ncbi:hypothetical protein [Pseudomonas sp. B6001]|uniref:hypothetical protein n=1 Tax=Pseudomonas sp. B6001 TaxID=2738813 RepID=UPI0015A17087|nr:hypothetical protein [Pseudomonas sp. B6001]NVZ96024.1 hypothetical protein [Pseudomonas sp. B6001]
MASKWIYNCPTALINETISLLSLTPQGQVSYRIGADFNFDSLYGLIEHDHNLDSETLFKTFKESVFYCFKKDMIKNHNHLLVEFDKRCHKSTKKEKFTIVFPIVLKNIYAFPRLHIDECIITFYNTTPLKYKKYRTQEILTASSSLGEEESKHTIVTVSTIAPNIESAISRSSEAFDIVLATLQIGFKKSINFLGSTDEFQYPTKCIVSLGQFQTIHDQRGHCHPNSLWENPDFKANQQPISLKNPSATISHLKKTLKKIQKLPYNTHVKSGLRNYSTAISCVNAELRLTKLWVTIEQLVMADDTEKLTKRVSFFYSKQDLHRSILKSLRHSRNTHIHAGKKPTNIDIKMFQLCLYIEHLLRFFISNHFKHKNTQEIGAFISLSTEATNISEQISRLKAVMKFISTD